MSLTDQYLEDDIHPIDIVENIASYHDWEFDRIEENQIAMAVQGQWRTYSITLAWSGVDETLRMICTFDMAPPAERLPKLYETINAVNETSWAGAFSFWAEHNLMVFRYGLVLAGGQYASAEQIDTMISNAVLNSERFYPAFQLSVYSDETPQQSLQVAIAEAYGRA